MRNAAEEGKTEDRVSSSEAHVVEPQGAESQVAEEPSLSHRVASEKVHRESVEEAVADNATPIVEPTTEHVEYPLAAQSVDEQRQSSMDVAAVSSAVLKS